MKRMSYIYLVATIYFGFCFSTEAIALQAPAALAKADERLLIPLEKSLIPDGITTCEDIRTQSNQQADQMIFVTQQQHEQIKSILAVPGLSDRIIKDKKLPADVRALFAEIKKDPKALDKKTVQALREITELKQQVLSRCR
jgi:CheY-like chemotaxis protein